MKREALHFINQEGILWKQLFSSATLWEGQEMRCERLVWIRITGVPLQLRDENFYNTIAELYGKIVVKSEFSWSTSKNHESVCAVVTESGKRIEEAVQVDWEERSYQIWVSEVPETTVNKILEELLSAVASEPTISDGSDEESVAGDNDEMEEGEIRKGDPGPSEPAIQPEKKVVQELTVDEESNYDSMHGNVEGVHGEQRGSKLDNSFPRMMETLNEGGVSNTCVGNPFNMGSNENMGQKNELNSRKRRRCMRSPTTQEKDGNDNWAQRFKFPSGLDLNSPARDQYTGQNEKSNISQWAKEKDIGLGGGEQGSQAAASDPPVHHQSGSSEAAIDGVEEVHEIDKEVLETIQLGATLGFDLNGAVGQLKKAILDEGGQNGLP
ncbi:hypothetical protein HanIR_Chr11g0534611 [Helianthus annuus]|nr:hypothetical protein HanIR_Chr11g0534611 [Helianthus annuus]